MNDGMGGRSRLPRDEDYWEALATRIERAAAAHLAPVAGAPRVWWIGPRLSPALAAAAVLAVVGAWMFLPTRGALPGGVSVTGAALAPEDPLAAAVLGESSPPPIEGLLGLASPEGR